MFATLLTALLIGGWVGYAAPLGRNGSLRTRAGLGRALLWLLWFAAFALPAYALPISDGTIAYWAGCAVGVVAQLLVPAVSQPAPSAVQSVPAGDRSPTQGGLGNATKDES
ncbi:hypothetical protein GCM10028820_03330 [Tessaracoccus terricola]